MESEEQPLSLASLTLKSPEFMLGHCALATRSVGYALRWSKLGQEV